MKRTAIAAVVVMAALFVVEPGPATADPTPLKTLAAAARGGDGIKVGSAIRSTLIDPDSNGDETYEQRAAAEFSLIASENDLVWEASEPTEPTREGGDWVHTYAWDRAEEVVDFAEQNGQTVIGHHLVWHSSVPGWWPRIPGPDGKLIPDPAAYTPEEVHDFLQDRVEDTVERFEGRIDYWSVVNEVFAEDGSWRPSIWQRAYPNPNPNAAPDSYGYIADSFRWAHAADPSAKLYINEYGVEGNTAKARALYDLVKRLRDDDVPIHGVGFQTHRKLTDGLTGFADMLRRFADLGVEVYITEMDVRIHETDTSGAELLQQAEVYGRVVRACLDVAACKFINLWGFTDAYSWIGTVFHIGWGRATVLTNTFAAKPAYHRIAAELANWTVPLQNMAGWWRLDDWVAQDDASPVASDVSGHGRPAAVVGTALGYEGRMPGYPAFRGNGVSTQATTAGPVLQTSQPFTVSAWVSLTDTTRDQVVVGQDAATRTAFSIGFNVASQRWYFSMADAYTPGPGFYQVFSTAAPRPGVWTHVTGVWNRTWGRLVLYVNGKLNAAVAPPATFLSWASTGALRIGAAMNGRHLAGSISDVRAYQRVLSDAEVLDATTLGHFGLDGQIGDTSFFLRDGSPRPEVTRWLGTPSQMPTALRLTPGTNSEGRVEAVSIDVRPQALRTERSYTVSAWVNRDGDGDGTVDGPDDMVAVAQDGDVRSAFRLGVRSGHWSFAIPSADAQAITMQFVNGGTAGLGWTHLVGVYDAEAGQIRLYVNDVAQTPVAGVTSWASVKSFHLGSAFDAPRWVGGLDDVRVYQTPLTQNEVNLIPDRS